VRTAESQNMAIPDSCSGDTVQAFMGFIAEVEKRFQTASMLVLSLLQANGLILSIKTAFFRRAVLLFLPSPNFLLPKTCK